MKLVLIGIQGSGKSTQGNLLSEQLKLPYLSTGHIFREIAKESTPLGKYVKAIMRSGELIPDKKVIEIVNDYLSKPAYRKGYILDGFPRTLTQAKKFKNNVDKVIVVDIPDKEALWRLAYRNQERDDDTMDAIKKRIEEFHHHINPVLDYYYKKGKVANIDGTKSIEEVNQDILKSLGKQKIQNRIESWKQKNNTIVAIVGMPGSGKSEAAYYLKEKYNIPIVSFSDTVNKIIEKKGLEHNLKNHHEVRMGLREQHGFEAMAKLNQNELEKKLKKHNMVIIEGMRSWEEYEYLKKEFPKANIFLIAIYTNKRKRYERVAERTTRSGLKGEDRDIDELINTHMGPTIAYADFLVKNNFSIEDLHHKLDEVYREIYYS